MKKNPYAMQDDATKSAAALIVSVLCLLFDVLVCVIVGLIFGLVPALILAALFVFVLFVLTFAAFNKITRG